MMINRPIRSEAEYKTALAEVETYFDREPEQDTPEADRFDLLTLLIEAYEEQQHPIGPPHPIEMIRHRMRTAGYTQADLAELLGSRARASEVLAKKRRLTLQMIWKLSHQWKIPADVLVAPYPLAGAGRRRTSPSRAARRKAA
jgi:HTH-type transcriptional regulator/antitoxin HigA